MIEVVITLIVYLIAGWCIASVIDTENILLDMLIMLFWPLIGVLGVLTFIFWG